MWFIVRLKMPCFSHQGVYGGGGGGGHDILPTIVGYATRRARKKHTPNNGGRAFKKCKGKNLRSP